jgi:Fe-S-cluster containining protein
MSAEVYGHIFSKGTPCHFLGKSCTIYKDRPAGCVNFTCVWLNDKKHLIPEWIKPSLSDIIITERSWGQNNEYIYWAVIECGKTMRSDVLHWLLIFCEQNEIDLEYEFNFQMYRRGSIEFQNYMKGNI